MEALITGALLQVNSFYQPQPSGDIFKYVKKKHKIELNYSLGIIIFSKCNIFCFSRDC